MITADLALLMSAAYLWPRKLAIQQVMDEHATNRIMDAPIN
jgi:hypothetical protein